MSNWDRNTLEARAVVGDKRILLLMSERLKIIIEKGRRPNAREEAQKLVGKISASNVRFCHHYGLSESFAMKLTWLELKTSLNSNSNVPRLLMALISC